jgi:hypothetical protein
MDKVQKLSNPEYYTPSSEPFRIFCIIYITNFNVYEGHDCSQYMN